MSLFKYKIKNKRTLKNGSVAGYVYYNDEKKWKWRYDRNYKYIPTKSTRLKSQKIYK